MQDPDEIVFDKTRDFIGQGVFGSVFKGTCRGQVVAVKVPLHQEALTPTQLKEFRDEVAILRFYLTILLRFLCVLTQFVSRYFIFKKFRKIFHPHVVLFLGACLLPQRIMIVTQVRVCSFV